MASREPGWELYRSLLAVLSEGSLSGAARALGVAQPTIGRHVQALEEALGTPLFTRSPSGFAATEAALALRPYAESMAAAAAAAQRAAAGQGAGVRGAVRLTASEVIGVEVLAPILSALHEQHPELAIELVLTNRAEDLLRREADVAVRMFRPVQEALVARRIGAIELGLFAHEAYLARRGVPHTESQLAEHALIGFDQETPFIRSLQARVPMLTREAFAFRSDSDLAQLAAIRAGFGIGVCQVALGQRSGLVRVLPDRFALELDTWVTMHEDLRESARCRVVFEALVTGLARYVEDLAATPSRARSHTPPPGPAS